MTVTFESRIGAQHPGRCACGARIGARNVQCARCHRQAQADRRDGRYALIAQLWADERSYREIGIALGMTRLAVRDVIHRMRVAGWDLPRRWHGRTRG
ncbi:MAG: hypothetical protein ACLP50_29315 [Solirubrobacteraceae bacterium]